MSSNITSFTLDRLKADPNFAQIFAKKAQDLRKDKAGLVEASRDYQKKYEREIDEGTEKRKLMLEDGQRRGLKEEQIFQDNQLFIPTKQTPILNFLYFILTESIRQDPTVKELYLLKEEMEKKYPEIEHGAGDAHNSTGNASKLLPEMVSYVYKGIDHEDTFATAKKLKTMAMSDNEKEAFVAFRKCKALCDKYNLDFDKIPYNR
jgi:hypothetical protein